jgi:Protein of unknown function (DUF4244)
MATGIRACSPSCEPVVHSRVKSVGYQQIQVLPAVEPARPSGLVSTGNRRSSAVGGRSGQVSCRRVNEMQALCKWKQGDDAGMTTAEYAVGTVAACGFGGVLYKVLTSDAVINLLTDILRHALTLNF